MPIPTVSRLTHIKMNANMAILWYAMHGILKRIIPPPSAKDQLRGDGPCAAELGARDSDFLVVKGIMEQKVYDAFVQDEGAAGNIAIFCIVLSIVGELTPG